MSLCFQGLGPEAETSRRGKKGKKKTPLDVDHECMAVRNGSGSGRTWQVTSEGS